MRNLFFLILFLSHAGFAQESIVRLWQKGNLTSKVSDEKALVIFEKAFNEAVKQKSLLWQATICVDQSGSLHAIGKYQEAVERCLLGLKILKNNNIKNDSTQFKLHSAVGACYKTVYNLQESLKQFELANQIYHSHPELENKIPLYVMFHYSNQGGIWYSLGDFNRAILYFEKAISFAEKLPSKSDHSFMLTHLSRIYKYQKSYSKAIELLTRAIGNYNINGKIIKDVYLSEMFFELGECYYEIENYDLANYYINQSKQIAKLNLSIETAARMIPKADIFIANMYLRIGQKEESRKIFKNILNQNIKSGSYDLNMNYQALKGLSAIETLNGNYLIALSYIQKALSEISNKELNDNLENPSDFSSMHVAIGVFVILNQKIDILLKLYLQKEKTEYLISAYNTQKLSVDIAKKIRQSHETIESRSLFSNSFYEKYEKLIEICFLLFEKTKSREYLKASFKILEESKSIILSDNLSLQNSYRNFGSDSLISKLKANQAYLAYLKGSSDKNSESINTYELKVNQILEELSIVNKSYVESFKSETLIDLKSFQEKLDSKSAYFNYILIKDQIYITLVKNGRVNLNKIQINSRELATHKNLLKTALTTNPGPYSGFKARKSAAYFYNILIKPFEADLKGVDNLIINPDNEMIELSFDILVPHEKSNDYLIKKYNISYLNSALNYNDQIKNKFSRADQNWLSFAPFGSKTKNNSGINIQNLTILPSTIKEINGIKGQSIINEKSTKQTFVKTIGELKDRVILIATHASENNGEPYLNFFPANDNYKLYANEIQYLDFKTPLVILGACESNAGKKMKGSGVLSIAKAFSIGGCPSVVGSLWEVHDESMAVLVSLFYKHLMRGERKDVALRLAKLEYLETETGLRNDPPYYWAHLQIIGDVSPLIIWPVILRYVMYGLMVLILSGSIIYGVRSRKRFFN